MKRAGWIIGIVLAVVLVLGLVFGPGIWRAVTVWNLAEDFFAQPERSMSVVVTTAEEENWSFRLDWQQIGGKRIYTAELGGVAVFCCDGVIYLENGKGYDLGDAAPDGSKLPGTPWALYPLVKIQHQEENWVINTDSAELLPELYGSALLLEEDGEGICTLQWISGGKNGFLHIWAGVHRDREPLEVPEAVLQAIDSGDVQADKDLTEDVLRLMAGWGQLSQKDPLGMTLKLSADCGPVRFSDTFSLYSSGGIGYMEKDGLGVYFSDRGACTADGTLLSARQSEVEAAQLLGLVYQLCLNGEFSCQGDVYRLELDRQGMERLAYAIAPEAEGMDVLFQSGTLELEMTENEISAIRVQCGGSVEVLLVSVAVDIAAELNMMPGEIGFAIPQAVLDAIG